MSRYRASPWTFPEELSEFEYGPDDVVAKVYHSRFRFRKHYFSIAKGLVGQRIAIRPHPESEELFKIYFCHHLLRTININQPDYD